MTPIAKLSTLAFGARPNAPMALGNRGQLGPLADHDPTPWGAALLIALAGFALRLLHNATLLESPLYWHPLGGHVVFFGMAGGKPPLVAGAHSSCIWRSSRSATLATALVSPSSANATCPP